MLIFPGHALRRLAFTLLKLAAVLLLGGFLGATLIRMAPGFGTDEQELDMRLSHESVLALRHANSEAGLTAFYAQYIRRLAHGDLGYSKTLQQPVRQLLIARFPETLKSVAMGLLFAWTLGLALAAAPHFVRLRGVSFIASLFAGIVLCVPAAVLALLFVLTHVSGRLVLGLAVFPKVFAYARGLLAQSAQQPHVVTAWAKGLGRLRIFVQHILPTCAPQLLALAGVSVSIAFAAAIPMEVVCDLPGIGQLAWKAAMSRDLELLVNLTMLITAITLVANALGGWMAGGSKVVEP